MNPLYAVREQHKWIFITIALVISFFISSSLLFNFHEIFLKRGRGWSDIRFNQAQDDWSVKHNNLTYTISSISGDSLELAIHNRSFIPYFFTAYIFEGWENSLPDSVVFQYAANYKIVNRAGQTLTNSGFGFYCGTGLGNTIIRPYEVFHQKISKSALLDYVLGPYSFVEFTEEDEPYLILNKKSIANYDAWKITYQELFKDCTERDFKLILYLNVINYFTGKQHLVESNPLEVSIDELLMDEGRAY